jgi:hypothetical protein
VGLGNQDSCCRNGLGFCGGEEIGASNNISEESGAITLHLMEIGELEKDDESAGRQCLEC